MTRRARCENGFTLIELLVSITIGVIVIGAAAAAFGAALNGASDTQQQLADSHDGQLVETYLPADIQSAQTVTTGATDPVPCTGSDVVPPSAGQPRKLTMSWVDSSTAVTFYVTYQVVHPVADEWNLVRFACRSDALTIKRLVVAHDLKDPADPAWATAGADSLSCGRIGLTLVASSGHRYRVTGNARTPSASAPTCPAVTTTSTPASTTTTIVSPSPELVEVEMYDRNGTPNGKIDELVATFSKSVNDGCKLPTQWAFVSGPSGASNVSNVSRVSPSRLRLTVPEGGGAPNTAVGGFQVTFTASGTCNAQPSGAVEPADKAGPVLVGITGSNATVARQLDKDDTITFTFSEPVLGVPGSSTLTLVDPPGNEPSKLTMIGITPPDLPIPNVYIKNNTSVTFPLSVTAPSPTSITVKLGDCAASCADVLPAPGDAGSNISFSPASTLGDDSQNPAAPVVFTTGPVF